MDIPPARRGGGWKESTLEPFFTDHWTTIYQGSCLDVLPLLPANSVHTCVTSPPYWGLRDYGTATWAGGDAACDHAQEPPRCNGPKQTPAQVSGHASAAERHGRLVCHRCGAVRHDQGIGNEAAPDCLGWATGSPCGACWVCRLVAVFREVRRVLRHDGTLWLNVGDAYARNAGSMTTTTAYGINGPNRVRAGNGFQKVDGYLKPPPGLKPKDLCLLPARLALALQADGWWLRAECIWHKMNGLPESVRDRPTKGHEQVYLLTKAPRYFYDPEAVRQPSAAPVDNTGRHSYPPGRNLRSVWSLASEPFSGAHFAAFPSALVRCCLRAACSAGGVCAGCGAPSRRVVERAYTPSTRGHIGKMIERNGNRVTPMAGMPRMGLTTTTTGFAPACSCDAGATVPATVLDPFAGAGTTLLTARDLFIKSIGIELSPTYCALAASRLTQGVLTLGPGG